MEFTHIIQIVLVSAIPILIAIVLHEVAHGFVAYKLGDPTAEMAGRLTLNPVAHIDLFGTILMPMLLLVLTNGQFAFGYAKPVPINPYNFKNPKRDMAISAAGGPATNIALAIVSILLLKYLMLPVSAFMSDGVAEAILKPIVLMLNVSITINIILAVFNMLPIPPLDGGRVLMGLLPYKQADTLSKIEPYGMIIVLLLLVTGMTKYILLPANIILQCLINVL